MSQPDSKSALHRLNSLPASDAEAELRHCCGSANWARAMAERRPFADIDEVLAVADNIWRSLGPDDWLESFRSHPKIGERKTEAQVSAQSRAWSKQEQAAAGGASADTLVDLKTANDEYQRKFGYIFIVCASGKSAEEMLTILRRRLPNDAAAELHIAAEEQRKITALRLERLIRDS